MRQLLSLFLLAGAGLCAQQQPNAALPSQPASQPLYRFAIVSRTLTAINYRQRSGPTRIDFRGTVLMPQARGEAKVESQPGYMEIDVEFDNITSSPAHFGPQYLAYVLWAITPQGRAANLGEVIPQGAKSKLKVTTQLQAFGLLVTAEPYAAVTRHSHVVVLENVVGPAMLGPATQGLTTMPKVEQVDVKYQLMQPAPTPPVQGLVKASPYRPPRALDPNMPLPLRQAWNAVDFARYVGADRYAAETFQKADMLLQQAEDLQRRNQAKQASMVAREAAQTAEDARMIAMQRAEEERLAQERQVAAKREAQAKAQAEAEAQSRAEAEAGKRAEAERRAAAEAEKRAEAERRRRAEEERLAAEQAQLESEKARLAAEETARLAARQKAEAEAGREAAFARQQAAQAEAANARQEARAAARRSREAEREKAELRDRLRQQLDRIMETRDSARGLIVCMSDVLFDSSQATLTPGAREKLTKVFGIVQSQPGLRLEIEGHTDSLGPDEFNQKLSEQRSLAVRDYLAQQGIPTAHVTARGLGENQPVASNSTAAGRQRNRRVELVLSGDPIGTQGSASRTAPPDPPSSQP